MNNAYFHFKEPINEPVRNYEPNSQDAKSLKEAINQLKSEIIDIPMYIGDKKVFTDNKGDISSPQDLSLKLATHSIGEAQHVHDAINAALNAKEKWEKMSWEHRAGIFLKAAELLAQKYRYKMNAATMLGQSKNAFQAEIDSACELIDFLRFNVHYLSQIYADQPLSPQGINNRLEYRPLEGFVLAVTPFNFTAIGGNLPTSAAMCGNVVVWKPANTQIYSAHVFMEILREAGLPDGVINMVYTSGPLVGEICFNHPEFAGVHFTGSTGVFQGMWKSIGENIHKYKSYPRIVGETGGKDFVFVHPNSNVKSVVANLLRGAFEYQGQKCSAASRAYLPSNLAEDIKSQLIDELKTVKVGTVEDFTNFVNAVIDEKAFNSITKYIDIAKNAPEATIISGGQYDKSKGYFIHPTVIETTDPKFITMQEEIFGPVLTIYVYDENKLDEAIELVNTTSPYALTGAIFAQNAYDAAYLTEKLTYAAGNFYINDKPTGAVVGQQPFGGARASGTNDKAGSKLNLYRWLNPRTIKQTYLPVENYRYPFHQE